MNVGAGELGVVLLFLVVFGIVFYGSAIWTLVDAARRPDWQFDVTGTSKTLWIVLPIVGMLTCGLVSVVAFVVYLASVRPKLEAAARTHRSGVPGWRAGSYPPPPPPPPPPSRPM